MNGAKHIDRTSLALSQSALDTNPPDDNNILYSGPKCLPLGTPRPALCRVGHIRNPRQMARTSRPHDCGGAMNTGCMASYYVGAEYLWSTVVCTMHAPVMENAKIINVIMEINNCSLFSLIKIFVHVISLI